MITNERQYLNTKAEVGRFERALAKADEQNKHLHAALRKAAREGLESHPSISALSLWLQDPKLNPRRLRCGRSIHDV